MTANLFTNLPSSLPDETIEAVLSHDGLRIERIVSLGHRSPDGFWYDQDAHEWVALLQGAAKLRFEDMAEEIELKPGDYLDIPPHRRHRVEWTTPDEATIWLAVHFDEK